MGSSQNAAVSFTSLLLISSLLLTSNLCVSEAQSSPPIADGLSWNFFQSSCPDLESIIQKQLKKVFKKDIEQAAGLLRLHFHDCFVLGCEGSVLLNAPNGGPSTEQNAIPNQSLRQQAFEIIEDLRRRVHNKCGRIVSCADIVALAARDSVLLAGGPNYNIPLGRRDGLTFATDQETLDNLPSPFSNATVILDSLSTRQNLDATDVVALSGGHTIGISHCGAFTGRLYPNQDSSMDKTLANNLKNVCPTLTSNGTVVMDIRTPNKFDNRYYVGLMNRQGLFTSDQDLYTDRRTRGIVTQFAINETLFFEKFVGSMIKMGQLRVLTGRNGQIRARCSATNSNGDYLKSMVEKAVEGFSELI